MSAGALTDEDYFYGYGVEENDLEEETGDDLAGRWDHDSDDLDTEDWEQHMGGSEDADLEPGYDEAADEEELEDEENGCDDEDEADPDTEDECEEACEAGEPADHGDGDTGAEVAEGFGVQAGFNNAADGGRDSDGNLSVDIPF